jgi:hypothetical protein
MYTPLALLRREYQSCRSSSCYECTELDPFLPVVLQSKQQIAAKSLKALGRYVF